MKHDLFSSPRLRTRVQTQQVGKAERALGYFLGPCLVYTMYTGIAGTYLTQFYTDVLGLAGAFLTMMPLLSKLLSSVISLLIGRMIDRTRTAQGKARPWILLSGPLLAICGVLLYAVPRAGLAFRLAWVVISYNLFFSLAFSTYSLSHSLMVPLSTRDSRQRDELAMLTSTGTAMIPGMLSTIIMPLLVNRIGVGAQAQHGWLTVMGLLSAVAVPATVLEYCFTCERVTGEGGQRQPDAPSFRRQVAACFRDRYWVMIVAFTLIVNLCSGLSTGSMLYYCNWVLGNSVESGAARQILVNMVGQAPLGIGVVALWPLVRKFGKRRVTVVGFSVAVVGNLLVLLGGSSMPAVLAGLVIRSTGSLPTYVTAALLAEALDHVQQTKGLRADGFSASVNSMSQTVVVGLTQTLLLAGIQLLGYIPPETTTQVVTQPQAVQDFFRWCFAGIPMIGYGLCAGIMWFYTPGDCSTTTPVIARR